jgi:hypothetical protein
MNNEDIENILGNINFEVETENEWVEPLGLDKDTWKQILNYITNLQQRIGKAIEFIKSYNSTIKSRNELGIYVDFMSIPKELLEILGEKEIEEIPQFKGTLEQLDNLTILGDKENE